jgi:gliding motility-associated-like protein
VQSYPIGSSVTPDGSEVYVTNDFGAGGINSKGTVSVISTATNTITSTITVDSNPLSRGSFISGGQQCEGAPVKFTITVDPPSIVSAGNLTGNISACVGTPSANPNIQQFTVSQSYTTSNITINSPDGFEVSLAPNSGYGNSIILGSSPAGASSTIVYVRSAGAAAAGPLSGNIVVFYGSGSQNIAVSGVINAQETPSVSIAASANGVCEGIPATFTATPANGGSSPVFQWRLNGANTGTNSTTYTSNTLVSGDVVTCVMTSDAGCVVPATVTSNSLSINVLPPVAPSLSIAASANNVCAGTPVTFTATPVNSGPAPVFQWQVNGSNAGANSATFTSSTLAGGDVVSCEMISNAPCATPVSTVSNNVNMTVNPTSVVDAGGDQTIKIGNSIQLNATATGTITDITWTPATGLSNNKILNPIATPTETTTYTLMVQTTDGCVGMDMATINVLLPITIPNTFTPNGDGVNDTWAIKDLATYQSCTVQIFNRWGQNVYSSVGYGTPWDGTYKGSPLPTGTYYYVIDLKNNLKLLSGYVAIIR